MKPFFDKLKKHGKLVGTNELGIAATAVALKPPVAPHNADDFRRVPVLPVFAY